jgi:tRNA pseudouridine55 synthase
VTPAPADVRGRSEGPTTAWSGLLLVDKPVGLTSHDVVDKVRRRLRTPGAGHLGTLDPGASGLLILALGAATRCVPVWQGGEKTYEATVRFGIVTSTQDLQGEVLERRDVSLDEARIRAAALAFVGEFDQVPPMVSALKVGGRRLYKLARRGEVVERSPRRVTVHAWEWLDFALPEATFRVRCAGGTYVRTLVHDLGAALGTGGALAKLRRLRSEPYGLERAITLRDLDLHAPEVLLERAGVPLDRALDILPALTLAPDAAEELGYGRRPLVLPGELPLLGGPRSVVMRGPGGMALALGELVPSPEHPGHALACPHVVFPWTVREGR